MRNEFIEAVVGYRNQRVLLNLNPKLFTTVHFSANALREMIDTLITTFQHSNRKVSISPISDRPRSTSETHRRDMVLLSNLLHNEYFQQFGTKIKSKLKEWNTHNSTNDQLEQPLFLAAIIYALHVGQDTKYCRTFLQNINARDSQRLEHLKMWIEDEMLDHVWLQALVRHIAWTCAQLRTTSQNLIQ